MSAPCTDPHGTGPWSERRYSPVHFHAVTRPTPPAPPAPGVQR